MGHELRTDRELSLDFLRVCESAAIASARTMGQGDRKYSDHVAVEAMRETMDTVPMRGRIVIGEGERDEAPMLYIGEEVGGGFGVVLGAVDEGRLELRVDAAAAGAIGRERLAKLVIVMPPAVDEPDH